MRGPCWKVVTELQTWIYVCIIHEYLTIIKMQIIRETVETEMSSIKFQDVSVWILHLPVTRCSPIHLWRINFKPRCKKRDNERSRCTILCLSHRACCLIKEPAKWITNEIWLRSDKNRKRMILSNISSNWLWSFEQKEHFQNRAKSK